MAKIIANDLGFIYTDTGAMYRSITYLALKTGCSLEDEAAIAALIDQYPITFEPTEHGQEVFAGGESQKRSVSQK